MSTRGRLESISEDSIPDEHQLRPIPTEYLSHNLSAVNQVPRDQCTFDPNAIPPFRRDQWGRLRHDENYVTEFYKLWNTGHRPREGEVTKAKAFYSIKKNEIYYVRLSTPINFRPNFLNHLVILHCGQYRYNYKNVNFHREIEEKDRIEKNNEEYIVWLTRQIDLYNQWEEQPQDFVKPSLKDIEVNLQTFITEIQLRKKVHDTLLEEFETHKELFQAAGRVLYPDQPTNVYAWQKKKEGWTATKRVRERRNQTYPPLFWDYPTDAKGIVICKYTRPLRSGEYTKWESN